MTHAPLFELGQIVATPGALAALETAGGSTSELLSRHVTGDWGNVSAEDSRTNDWSVNNDARVLSAYALAATGAVVWIITEADRSVTTLLLPDDY